jgi:hypothetical protein
VDLVTPVRPPWRAAAVAVAGCAIAGTLTALLLSSSGESAVASPSGGATTTVAGLIHEPDPLPPAERAVVVPGRNGTKIVCPHGTEPEVSLTDARFEPALTGGTSFVPGRYRIRLVGTVVNATSQGIDVRGIQLTVGGRPWSAEAVAVTRVSANSSAPLVLEGEYLTRRTERVDVRAELQWRWTDHSLSPCGAKGLADDV